MDLPAPLGPTIPTRLHECSIKQHLYFVWNAPPTHLDNDNAQLTLRRLGSFLPGYVNVHLDILRMARVLLRTPMSDPGDGNENLIELAARV